MHNQTPYKNHVPQHSAQSDLREMLPTSARAALQAAGAIGQQCPSQRTDLSIHRSLWAWSSKPLTLDAHRLMPRALVIDSATPGVTLPRAPRCCASSRSAADLDRACDAF